YEFGYGLSYTNFEYSDLQVAAADSPVHDTLATSLLPGEKPLYKISFTVTNTGDFDGCETSQIYVKNPHVGNDKVEVSSIALAEFAKISLKKGESKRIEFVLGERSFSLFNSNENQFSVIAGEYTIEVGSSVKDIRLEKKIRVEGLDFESWLKSETSFDGKSRVFKNSLVHKKGEFTCQDSLFVMAKESRFVRNLVNLLEFLLVLISESKSREDPANKITIYGLEENPIESLISTGGEIFSEKLMNFIIRRANRGANKRK
ncbi:MAG: fibronectin type III-like domain-contianing protein, partial [Treponemataceae bacterium]|nr:fibronectin type III-like domain-contianing protein [Treponemataceae bacterium]